MRRVRLAARSLVSLFIVVALAAALPSASSWALGSRGDDGPAPLYRGQYPVVRTDDGAVRGEAQSMVTSFKGIPYAAPPVGERRWQAPQPVEPWRGVRDAREFGGSCVQGTGWDPGYEEPTLTEDCLYLNVYRPTNARKGKLPVLVWNHGGGNTGGAGRDTNPDKFVTRQDVVYVTINYRLGAMGYLFTESLEEDNPDGAAGNFGVLDQQAALRWIQDNIRAFGGDPKNVTLAGQSAGASNTVAQLASPSAEGLFDKAILQSGGRNPLRTLEDARTDGEGFAEALDCPAGADQLDCLRSKTPAEVLGAQQEYGPDDGAVAGSPVVPVDPVELMKSGDLTDLPVIVGGTSDESQQSVFGQYDHEGNPLTGEQVDELVADEFPDAADRVLAAYPVEDYWSPTVAWGAIQSDERACQDLTLRNRLAADTDAWAYEFAEKDGPAFTSIWRLDTDYPFGATHVNDLGYLWDYLGTALPFSTEQVELSNQMISYWGSFARDGDPNVAHAPDWPQYRPDGKLMQFVAPHGEAVDRDAIADSHNCGLWDEVSPAA